MKGHETTKLACPVCNSPTWVYFTDTTAQLVMRRRKCDNGHRFVSREFIIGPVDSPVSRAAIDSGSAVRYDDDEVELKRLLEA